MIRPEQPCDIATIHAVHVAAFPTNLEARLVDVLRAAGRLKVSLVAEAEGEIVGHIAFSGVTLEAASNGLGLAPLAVVPPHQRRGHGGELIRAGLTAAIRMGGSFVVVLGDPSYYSRFGFAPASNWSLRAALRQAREVIILHAPRRARRYYVYICTHIPSRVKRESAAHSTSPCAAPLRCATLIC